MDLQNTIFEREDNIAIITVNRPDKRNALNKDVRRELRAILEEVKADPRIKVLVITGAGDKAFIAGSDIAELKEMSPLDFHRFAATLGQQLYTDFENLEIPVIAMINGFALGAGLELAMACDIRVAAEGARLGQPEILLGIIPAGGGTQRLTRLVGAGKARELIYTGDMIDAAEAERIGLVNKVVPAAELRPTVMELARKIASRSGVAIRLAKKAINKGANGPLELGLAYEAAMQCLAFTSEDHAEGLGAFLEKRQPEFKDR
ncbi:MAG TPA: crotonase [Dehalococcoidia bacterium]|nr:crotonase [Dehalococcoidia bacterium]